MSYDGPEKRVLVRTEVLVPALMLSSGHEPASADQETDRILDFNCENVLVLSNGHQKVGDRVRLRIVDASDGAGDECKFLDGRILFERPLRDKLDNLDYKLEFVVGLDEPFPAEKLLENRTFELPSMKSFSRILLYESLLKNSKDIIYIIDPQGTFLGLSKNVKELLGYDYRDLLGHKIYEFADEESCEKIRERIEGWENGEEQPESVDIRIESLGGAAVELRYFSWPIRIEGKLKYIQGIARDITQQKLYERIREHTTEIYDKLESLDALFDGIQNAATEILKPYNGLICLYDERNGYCIVRSIRGRGIGEGFEPIVKAETCPIYKKLKKSSKKDVGSFFILDDNDADCCPNCRATYSKGKLLGIPLRTRQKQTNSFICLRFEERFSPPEGTEGSLQGFSIQAGSAIELAKLLFLQNIESKLLDQFYVGRDLNNYLGFVIRLICEEIGIEACSIFIRDSENILRLRATTGIVGDPPNENVLYFDHEGMTGRVARTGNILLTTGTPKDGGFINKFGEKTEGGVKRWIGVPIKNAGGLTLGVLRCMNRKVKDEQLDGIFFPHDIEFLEHIARIIAMVIELSAITERTNNRLERIMHEFLSPIGGIRGNISYVQRRVKNPENFPNFTGWVLERKLEDVFESCELLRRHTDSIIIATKEEITPELASASLYGDVIIKCVNLVKPLVREQGYSDKEIVCSDSLKSMSRVWVDGLLFEEVFYNLLTNAIKYARDAKTFRICIEGEIRGEECILRFQDYGIGIDSQESESVFVEGFRSAKHAQKVATGKGIGLAIVKRIVEAHSGSITVSNNQDPTTFTIVFPRRPQHRGEEQ